MENYITKIHGSAIYDARISKNSAEAISELTKDDVKTLQLGQKNIYLKVGEDNLKNFLKTATLTEDKIGPYTYYRISDLTKYTLKFACNSINMDYTDKLALYITPENREFEFENNGTKYKFKWNHEILFNFGKFKLVENSESVYTLSSISSYINVLNLTEKVLKLWLGRLGTYLETYEEPRIVSYKKYTVASGAATESDIDVKTPLFGNGEQISDESAGATVSYKFNYTITKIEE